MERFSTWIVATAVVATEICVVPAQAQTAPTPPPAVTQRGLDLAGYLGWFNANKSGISLYNDWYHSLSGGLSLGYYWTDHVKTEIDVGRTSEAEIVGYGPVGNGPLSAPTEHYYRNVTFSVIQAYQFSRNAWVHPYLGAGLDLDWERHREERPAVLSARPGLIAGSRTDPSTNVHPKVAAVGGIKAYVSPHAFFRTDLKFTGARQFDQVIWRWGFGVDF
jgi:outer membrane protein W